MEIPNLYKIQAQITSKKRYLHLASFMPEGEFKNNAIEVMQDELKVLEDKFDSVMEELEEGA